jgi:hypothetical protein
LFYDEKDTKIALIGQIWLAKYNRLVYVEDKESFSVRLNNEDKAEILSWAENKGTMGWMMMYISEFRYFLQMGFIKCEFQNEVEELD